VAGPLRIFTSERKKGFVVPMSGTRRGGVCPIDHSKGEGAGVEWSASSPERLAQHIIQSPRLDGVQLTAALHGISMSD